MCTTLVWAPRGVVEWMSGSLRLRRSVKHFSGCYADEVGRRAAGLMCGHVSLSRYYETATDLLPNRHSSTSMPTKVDHLLSSAHCAVIETGAWG
jgi:hypothetical protein